MAVLRHIPQPLHDPSATRRANEARPASPRRQPRSPDGAWPHRPYGWSSNAAILDVGGVLIASPHERAWREALTGLADPDRLTHAIYRVHVAGKPRLAGAIAALEALGIDDAERLAPGYAAAKQRRLEDIIASGGVEAFADALRFVQALRSSQWPIAVTSFSRNAEAMLRSVQMGAESSLMDMFDVNLCGLDLPRGRPDSDIYALAAEALGTAPADCLVVEDTPAGVVAARDAGTTVIGVARRGDGSALWAAGADLVVATLDRVPLEAFATGRIRRAMS
jgi:HAD superfamily hydrolase (TIGR01509 family)